MAPEMTREIGHDHSVDWWAVGILLYEMLIGITPFFNKNRLKLFQRINQSKVKFPDRKVYQIDYSDEIVDLISKLLNKDPAQRLGSQGGVDEVIAHPFFSEIDVNALMNFQLEAPYKPAN